MGALDGETHRVILDYLLCLWCVSNTIHGDKRLKMMIFILYSYRGRLDIIGFNQRCQKVQEGYKNGQVLKYSNILLECRVLSRNVKV